MTTTTTTEPLTPAQLANLPRLITVKEAANVLGVVPWDVYQLVQSGELPAVRVRNTEPLWIHPRDVTRRISDMEYDAEHNVSDVPADQVCREIRRQFGSARARRMTELLIRASGSPCPCTTGGRCLFIPAALAGAGS